MFSALCILGLVVAEFLVVRFMLRNNPGPHVRKHIGITLTYSLLAMVVAVVLEQYGGSLFGDNVNFLGILSALPLVQFIAYMGVGAIEEFAKFYPFSRYLLSKRYMTSAADTVTYFAIIGLVFGVIEDALYAVKLGSGSIVFLRLAVSLFFHAALTTIVGYYFARSYFLGHTQRQTVFAYISVAAIHGIYDYSASLGNGMFLIAWSMSIIVNCYMFWLYFRAVEFDTQFRSGMSHARAASAGYGTLQTHGSPAAQPYTQRVPWQASQPLQMPQAVTATSTYPQPQQSTAVQNRPTYVFPQPPQYPPAAPFGS